MRGKKVDTDFLSSFIMECIKLNKQTPGGFVSEARDRINNIDAKIKEVEQLKVIRTKLLDVVNHFSTPTSPEEPNDDLKNLVWYSIPHPHICKFICDSIKNEPSRVEKLEHPEYSKTDIYFCIKELMTHKVISRTGNYLVRGNKYKEYTSLIFKEN